jgi:Dolichyl-phosphate-mannose-protein mannosyltransferase
MKDRILFICGVLYGIGALLTYYFTGSPRATFWLLAGFLVLVGTFYARMDKRAAYQSDTLLFTKVDAFALLFVLTIFGPLYLFSLYRIPWQINTDEVTIMGAAKSVAAEVPYDPFGIVDTYYGLPSFAFFALGKLTGMIGGVDLLHTRIVHASWGFLIIAISYIFFRTALSPFWAVGGAVILGANHALLAVSRMAMRDNSALLLEVAALTVFLIGLQKRSRLFIFVGGAVAGLAFYVYYPSRVTIFILLAALAFIGILFRRQISSRETAHLGFAGILGCAIVAAPVLIATAKNPSALNYQREQLLLFPEGRDLQKRWINAETTEEAVKENIRNGLTSFNNRIHDQGYIYPNYHHGFLDPLTGLLLWLGIVTVFLKREKTFLDVLALVGFFSLWLVLSFLINKSPNYTRLLITLPFVACFALEGLRVLAHFIGEFFAGRFPRIGPSMATTLFCCLVAAIFVWNLFIFGDFVQKGLAEGDDVGSTARFVEARKDIPSYTFYLAASTAEPYYDWGEAYQWAAWLGFFVGDKQQFSVISPEALQKKLSGPPFVIFMNRNVWQRWQTSVEDRYGPVRTEPLTSDGRLLAAEVVRKR